MGSVEIIAAIVSWIGILYLSDPKFLKWLLWDFSGIRFIWEKINTPSKEITDAPNYKPPATFMIWVFGVFGAYIALFTIASQRYENNLDRLENRTNAIFVLTSKDETRSNAYSLIPQAQNKKIPIEPDFLNPVTSITSLLLRKSEISKDTVEILKETIVGFKKQLSGADLGKANLRGAKLDGATLERAYLRGANLREAILWGANLVEANLRIAYLPLAKLDGANLRGAKLDGATLSGVNLTGANLRNASLYEADLRGAKLEGADLTGAILWGADLGKANLREAILWGANLEESNLREAILEGAILKGADLYGADLREAILEGAEDLTIKQLSKVKTLYEAELDPDLLEQVKKDYPHLLEDPKD